MIQRNRATKKDYPSQNNVFVILNRNKMCIKVQYLNMIDAKHPGTIAGKPAHVDIHIETHVDIHIETHGLIFTSNS